MAGQGNLLSLVVAVIAPCPVRLPGSSGHEAAALFCN
jgi:hypothetical protein